ncbi:MAG: ribonuclease PH [Bacillota bacterium]|jgi:ribonuclease PH|nr:ribonuclease PH [Candidatus Fermentithermobacillaceae bacterium]
MTRDERVGTLRADGRAPDETRPVRITPGYLKFPHGSCLVETGDTRVICTAMVEEKVPPFMKGTGSGWITAEYSMLPGATATRTAREVSRGRPGGRTVEIQRIIGRSLRAAVDLSAVGERTFWIDCDVIQADGGTRTASITGGFVALMLALNVVAEKEGWQAFPALDYIAGISVGIVDGIAVVDLPYAEDSVAQVDMNVVMTGKGEFIEVQGTGEHAPFSKERLDALLALAAGGIRSLMAIQREALGPIADKIGTYPGSGKSSFGV